MIVFAWFILSLVVGFIGSSRKIGFFGAFIASLFLSPLIGLVIAALSKSNEDAAREAQLMQMQRQQSDALSQLQGQQQPAPAALPVDLHLAVARLRGLRDRGIISQAEFLEEIKKV